MFKEPFAKVRHPSLGIGVAWTGVFDALFDTVDEGQEARPKLLKSNIQTSKANKGLHTTTLTWFNLAQLAL